MAAQTLTLPSRPLRSLLLLLPLLSAQPGSKVDYAPPKRVAVEPSKF